jgi:membrane protein
MDQDRTDPPRAAEAPPTPPLGDLFRALARDASTLIRQEAALARAELREAVRGAVGAAARIGIGAGLATVGVLVLIAALVVFLGDLMGGAYALSAAIVGGVLVAAGGGLAYLGARRASSVSLAPAEALASARETVDWARGEAAGVQAALASGDGRPPALAGPQTVTVPGRRVVLSAERTQDREARGAAAAAIGIERIGEGKRGEAGRGGDDAAGGAAAREDTRLPLDVPLWKRVLHEFQEDRVTDQAARVAYYFFLSLPPALMALFGLAGLFGDDATADWIMGQTAANLPEEAGGLMEGFVNDVIRQEAPGALSIGLLLALWAGSGVFVAFQQTLNTAYDIREERSWAKGRAIAVGMLLACALLFLGGSAVLIVGPAVPDWLGLGPAGRLAWRVAEWPLAFLLLASMFWLIYYVLPLRDQSTQKLTLFKASAIAAALWLAATAAFRIYITNFGSYSATYGLIGTIIVLLLWLYVTSLVIILGAEIASEMERTA